MKKYSYLLYMALLGMGCSNVVEIDVASRKPTAVLNAIFTPDSTWRVSLTESNDVLSDKYYYQPITDALVTIYNKNGETIETLSLSSTSDYAYKGKLVPQEDETYSIIAEIKGEKFSATSRVPKVVAISSVQVDSVDGNVPYANVGIKFSDPSVEKNYYSIKIIETGYEVRNYNGTNDTTYYEREGSFLPLDPKYQENSDDGFFDDDYIPRSNEVFFQDDLFDGQAYVFRLRPYSGRGATRTRVVLLSVSEEYYNYFRTKKIQDRGDLDPFSQPAQVYSNIKNGVGIFAGYGVSVVEVK